MPADRFGVRTDGAVRVELVPALRDLHAHQHQPVFMDGEDNILDFVDLLFVLFRHGGHVPEAVVHPASCLHDALKCRPFAVVPVDRLGGRVELVLREIVPEVELTPVGGGKELPHGVGRAPGVRPLILQRRAIGGIVDLVRAVPAGRGLEDVTGRQLLGLDISQDEGAGVAPCRIRAGRGDEGAVNERIAVNGRGRDIGVRHAAGKNQQQRDKRHRPENKSRQCFFVHTIPFIFRIQAAPQSPRLRS